MNIPEHLWYLRNTCAIFDRIPEADLAPLQGLLTRSYYEPGDCIHVAGDGPACVYFVKAGRVRLAHLDATGRELTLDYLGRGEIFGLLGREPGPTSPQRVIAAEASAVCRIPREHFETFMTSRPEVAFELTQVLEDRLARLHVRLHHLLFKDLRGRILYSLGYLAARYGERTHDGVRLTLRLTHQEIASLCGSTRESVSPVITALRAEGLLRFEGKHPVLLDRP